MFKSWSSRNMVCKRHILKWTLSLFSNEILLGGKWKVHIEMGSSLYFTMSLIDHTACFEKLKPVPVKAWFQPLHNGVINNIQQLASRSAEGSRPKKELLEARNQAFSSLSVLTFECHDRSEVWKGFRIQTRVGGPGRMNVWWRFRHKKWLTLRHKRTVEPIFLAALFMPSGRGEAVHARS